MKKIDDIIFDDSILVDYDDEIIQINQMFERLENSKSLQKAYKKFLKSRQKATNYNTIDTKMINFKGKPVASSSKISIESNTKNNTNYQFNHGYF